MAEYNIGDKFIVEIINKKLGTIFPIYDSSATTSKTFTIVNQ